MDEETRRIVDFFDSEGFTGSPVPTATINNWLTAASNAITLPDASKFQFASIQSYLYRNPSVPWATFSNEYGLSNLAGVGNAITTLSSNLSQNVPTDLRDSSRGDTTLFTAVSTSAQSAMFLANTLKDNLAELRNTDQESEAVVISKQREEETNSPDANVSDYASKIPLNRPLTTVWIIILLFLSTLMTLLALGIFLQFASVEIDIKLPTSEWGGEAGGGLLGSFSEISPRAYAFLVGSGILVGGGVAYAVAKYA
jgi:hypothetical protein